MSDRRRNRYTKGYREIAHDFLIMPTHSLPMPKPTKRFEREVRRVRYLSAWLFVKGQADRECHILCEDHELHLPDRSEQAAHRALVAKTRSRSRAF